MVSSGLHAQKIVADVTIKIDEIRINLETRNKFPDFEQILEEYINNADWTTGEIDVEIPVNVEFFFQSASMGSEDRYGVQILISDNSDVQYFDRRCNFRYMKGEILQHSPNSWTTLTSLVDFYIYLLLGEELDKFGKFMGTPYFEKAKLVAEQGNFIDGRYIFGWDQRNKLIQELLSDKNKPFREMKDFYFYGYYFIDDDPRKARQYIHAAVDIMADILNENPDHERCKKFLSAHYIEIIDLFKDTPDKGIFAKLLEIDPDHAEAYKPYTN